jgi:hypothetical protein
MERQIADVFGQIRRWRHQGVLHQDRDDRDALLERCGDFSTDAIRGAFRCGHSAKKGPFSSPAKRCRSKRLRKAETSTTVYDRAGTAKTEPQRKWLQCTNGRKQETNEEDDAGE